MLFAVADNYRTTFDRAFLGFH